MREEQRLRAVSRTVSRLSAIPSLAGLLVLIACDSPPWPWSQDGVPYDGPLAPTGTASLDTAGISFWLEDIKVIDVASVPPDGASPATLVLGHSSCSALSIHEQGCTSVLYGPQSEGSHDLIGSKPPRLLGSDWEQAGDNVAAGDVDGDGHTDFLISASDDDGKAYLVYGPLADSESRSLEDADSTLTATWTQTGYLSTMGDLDGDGLADLVVVHGGLYPVVGPVQVVYEPVRGPVDLDDNEVRIFGWEDGFSLQSVDSGADLNGDGIDDLVVGAAEEGKSGPVYVFHGPVEGEQYLDGADGVIRSDDTYTALGQATSLTGDEDGDGCADLLVGAPLFATDRGAAYLFLGPIEGELHVTGAQATIQRQTTRSSLGAGVALVDLTADGLADVAVGADDLTDDMPTDGAVYIFYAPIGGTHDVERDGYDAARYTPEGDTPYGARGAGAPLRSVWDINEDGFDDLFVGGHPDQFWIVLGGAL